MSTPISQSMTAMHAEDKYRKQAMTAMHAADKYRKLMARLRVLEQNVLRLTLHPEATPEQMATATAAYRDAVQKIQLMKMKLEDKFPVLRTGNGLQSPYPHKEGV